MDTHIFLKDLQGIVRRRKRSFFTVFGLVALMAAGVALYLPPIYRSEAKLLAEDQQIPEEYVKSTITLYLDERLHSIMEQIFSRKNLLRIIEEYDLYADLRRKKGDGAALARMREDITVEKTYASLKTRGRQQGTYASIAFSLSYEGEEPRTAQAVTGLLARLFIEEDLRSRQRLASRTTDFFREELAELKAQVLAHEERITRFKAAHIGQLPNQNSANLQALARLDIELGHIDVRLRALEDRKIYLEGQLFSMEPLKPIEIGDGKKMKNPLEHLQALRLRLIRLRSQLSAKHPDILALENEIARLEAEFGEADTSRAKAKELQALRQELAAAQAKWGPTHPDVLRLRDEADLLSQELLADSTAAALARVAAERPDNPAYINLMIQMESMNAEKRALLEERQRLKEEMAKYERRIEMSPIIEQEYNELTRDYESAKQKYNESLNKLLTARIAQQMDLGQHGERFSITEPANLPQTPYKPDRLLILILGGVVALGAGIAVAALLEGIDGSVKTAEEVTGLTGVPVLASIAEIQTTRERQARYFKQLAAALALTAAVIGGAIFLHRHGVPMDTLWLTLQERFVEMGVMPVSSPLG